MRRLVVVVVQSSLVLGKLGHGDTRLVESFFIGLQNLLRLSFTDDDTGVTPGETVRGEKRQSACSDSLALVSNVLVEAPETVEWEQEAVDRVGELWGRNS